MRLVATLDSASEAGQEGLGSGAKWMRGTGRVMGQNALGS